MALAGWRVPVLVFEPAAAPLLLAALAELAPGDVVAGGSIGYLAAVARFADDLAARGRVLPALTAEEGGYAARWRPVLSAADAQRARDSPPRCRPPAAPPTAPRPARCSRACSTRWRTRRCAPGCPVPCCPRAAAAAPPESVINDRLSHRPAASGRGGGRRRRARGAGTIAVFADWLASSALPPARSVPASGWSSQPTAEGAGAGGAWRVEFSLQSAEDPSLMLPAADVWAGAGYGWLAGPGRAGHPEEELLAGLGAAARLFPALDGALREAAPAEVALDTAGALDFLRETGPLLFGAGFGVLMPDWARRARLGLKLTARSASTGSAASARQSQFGLQDLVSFRYDLALGDDVLSQDELAELARLKVPLVRVRGQWVELDDRHLKAALKFLEGRRSGTMTAAEVLGAALGAGGDPGELPLAEVDADGWLGDLLSGQADERLDPAGTPEGFHGTLRPYQQRGLSWLSFLGRLGVGAILADDMGLGKTVQLLALLFPGGRPPYPPVRGMGPFGRNLFTIFLGPTLLICPMSLTGNWQREAERFTPGLAVHVHHGADRLAGEELAAALGAADLVITTYQTAAGTWRPCRRCAGRGWSAMRPRRSRTT